MQSVSNGLWAEGSATKRGYVRAEALGQLQALRQSLGVEWGRLGTEGRQRGLRGGVVGGGLDDPVETAQTQLRTAGQGEGGVAGLPAQQPLAQPPPAQAVQQGLAEGGGALLRGRGALEGEGGATAGWTAGVQLLEGREEWNRTII